MGSEGRRRGPGSVDTSTAHGREPSWGGRVGGSGIVVVEFPGTSRPEGLFGVSQPPEETTLEVGDPFLRPPQPTCGDVHFSPVSYSLFTTFRIPYSHSPPPPSPHTIPIFVHLSPRYDFT